MSAQRGYRILVIRLANCGLLFPCLSASTSSVWSGASFLWLSVEYGTFGQDTSTWEVIFPQVRLIK
jgi:hypothetical protein